MTKIPATQHLTVIKPDSDPAEVIAVITALIQQLGTSMLTDVAVHSAQANGTDAETEFATFSTKVNNVTKQINEFAEKLYTDNDEMLGTMVLAALLHSVVQMQQFIDACAATDVPAEEEHDPLCENALTDETFNVPEGCVVVSRGKNDH